MSFFAELKRRNVIRVAAGYAVLAWVLLQIMDVLAPALHLPEWTITLVAVLLALGALPVLIGSWVFELTPEGLKRESEIPADQPASAHTTKKLNVAVIVLLLVAIAMPFLRPSDGGGSGQNGGQTPISSEAGNRSLTPVDSAIAVLPFADLSPGGDQGYFADGISEEILNLLAQHADLKVIARTSAFQFREAVDLREVGLALNADRILEGSVRTAGSRVRITAQLINAETGLHIWSETYDRELTDIFAVQDEIAAAITAALGVHLGVETAGGASRSVSAETLDAYDLYLRGRQALSERSQPGRLAESIELLQRAVAVDPDLVVARGTLAIAESLGSNWIPNITAAQASERGLAAAEAALARDPDCVEALVAKGFSLTLAYRIADAEAAFARALALRPNDAMAVNLTGDLYRVIGEHDRSLAYERRVVELDPLDAVALMDLAWGNNFARRYEDAIPAARLATSLSPNSINGRFAEAFALSSLGRLSEAEAVIADVDPTGTPLAGLRSRLSIDALLIRGDDEQAERLIEETAARWEAAGAGPAAIAQFDILRGDFAAARRRYQAALDAGDFGFLSFPVGTGVGDLLAAHGEVLVFPAALDELLTRRRASEGYAQTELDRLAAARAAYLAGQANR